MSKSLDIVKVAIVVIAVAITITAVLLLIGSALNYAHNSQSSLLTATSVSEDLKREIESGALHGDRVVYLARQLFSENTPVMIQTGENAVTYDPNNLTDSSSKTFVQSDDSYKGTVEVAENGDVVGVSFCKQGVEKKSFDLAEAKRVLESGEDAILVAQKGLWKAYQQSAGKYEKLISLCEQYNEESKENTRLLAKKLDAENDADTLTSSKKSTYYSALASKYQTEGAFYEQLTNALNRWADSKWFGVLMVTTKDEDGNYDDPESKETPEPDSTDQGTTNGGSSDSDETYDPFGDDSSGGNGGSISGGGGDGDVPLDQP